MDAGQFDIDDDVGVTIRPHLKVRLRCCFAKLVEESGLVITRRQDVAP